MTMTTILLDIEGTTTPITFVYDELFPYARREMVRFLQANAQSERFQKALAQLREEVAGEVAAGENPPNIPEDGELQDMALAAANFALWQMEKDRKATGLKELQGWIWDAGYRAGELRGVVYPDVDDAIRRWAGAGHRVAIYSSGSIEAQKLIFGFSTAGDLTPFLCAYFDTTTGPKKEAQSYAKIADALGEAPQDVVFFSDNLDEIRAADAAGMQTRLTIRPGNAPVEAHGFKIVTDFSTQSVGL